VAKGIRVIDLGADYRLTDPADYPRWYGFEHPAPELLARAVYGLPEQHRAEILALRDSDVTIVGSPGCYPTATLLGLYPLARAGLIADVVVDAKSGVSGAGRSVKADLMYSEVNESGARTVWRATGISPSSSGPLRPPARPWARTPGTTVGSCPISCPCSAASRGQPRATHARGRHR
jgi:hypothetical protein